MSFNVAKFLLKYVFDCENNIIQYFNNYCHVININNKFIYIFGSSMLEDINFIDNNKLVNILKIRVNSELKDYMLNDNMNYTEKWGITKVIFILFIIKNILRNKSSNNYFFDDTKENIDLVEKYIGENSDNNIICYGFDKIDDYDLKSKFIDIIKNIINNLIFYNSSI